MFNPPSEDSAGQTGCWCHYSVGLVRGRNEAVAEPAMESGLATASTCW